MVKAAFKRLVLRCFPELGERKHLPQLARIEKLYDLPTDSPKISTPFRPYKAADVQLLNPHTYERLDTPAFEQVTLATGQAHMHGLHNEPCVGMLCLIQYIDGLNSLPVITSVLPWQSLIATHKSTDVTLQQSPISTIKGSNGNWQINTTGEIAQNSDINNVTARERHEVYFSKQTTIHSHDYSKIDGNQVNEIMGALKTVVGEKALLTALEGVLIGSQKAIEVKAHDNMMIESLKTLHAKASKLAKVEGSTVWIGNDSMNALQILSDLITIVSDTNKTLSAHIHPPDKPPAQSAEFSSYSAKANGLKGDLDPIVG
ncbi:hypothetical protein [Pseudoalteromonas sp. S16_S37]|uniref:hypothetical protein n=1 Tax=Pseudoalteromonas sp. S16_S37 TaxID=2720228 RepID=UPI001680277B|nr:hypothetical protein [Pseudoalteromonas sp. S16_S37]MBD1582811.1 hypothetical protein [Pseudoalteromonas sp. S16_S37]